MQYIIWDSIQSFKTHEVIFISVDICTCFWKMRQVALHQTGNRLISVAIHMIYVHAII